VSSQWITSKVRLNEFAEARRHSTQTRATANERLRLVNKV